MGEYSETFTVDGFAAEVKELCLKFMRGFGYRVKEETKDVAILEKGSLRRNLFTFSLEEAHKHVVMTIVGNESAPVCTVSVSFSLPFLTLRKADLATIRSIIRSMKEFAIVSLSHESAAPQR